MTKKIIRLKQADINKAIIRGLSRSAWDKKRAGQFSEKVYINPKLKKPRYKKDYREEIDN